MKPPVDSPEAQYPDWAWMKKKPWTTTKEYQTLLRLRIAPMSGEFVTIDDDGTVRKSALRHRSSDATETRVSRTRSGARSDSGESVGLGENTKPGRAKAEDKWTHSNKDTNSGAPPLRHFPDAASYVRASDADGNLDVSSLRHHPAASHLDKIDASAACDHGGREAKPSVSMARGCEALGPITTRNASKTASAYDPSDTRMTRRRPAVSQLKETDTAAASVHRDFDTPVPGAEDRERSDASTYQGAQRASGEHRDLGASSARHSSTTSDGDRRSNVLALSSKLESFGTPRAGSHEAQVAKMHEDSLRDPDLQRKNHKSPVEDSSIGPNHSPPRNRNRSLPRNRLPAPNVNGIDKIRAPGSRRENFDMSGAGSLGRQGTREYGNSPRVLDTSRDRDVNSYLDESSMGRYSAPAYADERENMRISGLRDRGFEVSGSGSHERQGANTSRRASRVLDVYKDQEAWRDRRQEKSRSATQRGLDFPRDTERRDRAGEIHVKFRFDDLDDSTN